MLRPVMTVLKGGALAQLVGLIILPILSRAFAPETFGHFQAFQSIISVLIVVVMLRYEIAILRARSGRELSSVLALCILLAILSTAVVTLSLVAVTAAGWPAIIADLGFGWWWLSLSMLVIGWTQIVSYLATREAAYDSIANAKIAQGLANAGTATGLALAAPIGSSLILGDVAGRVANGYWLSRGRIGTLRRAASASLRGIRLVAIRYRDLSLISLPGALFSTASAIMTPLLIYSSFGAVVAGQFGLTERAAGLPIALIVAAVSQVHMGNLADDIRRGTGNARRYFRKLSILLAGLAFLPAVACVIFAPTLFLWVFGDGWERAALFAQVMAPAYFLALVAGGINMTLTIVGRQATQFAWDVGRFVAMAALWIYAPLAGWSVEHIVAGHSALLCLFSLAHLVLCYRALPQGRERPD